MNTKRITTLIFTLLIGTSLAFAGDGKGTQAKNHSEQLVKISSTMTEVAGSLVQLSASLNAMQAHLSQNNTSAQRESIMANLEKVRKNIALMSQELSRLPIQTDVETEIENSDIFFYEE